MENLNAEIIAIGTEILLGEITDTNSVFIAQNLRDVGINLYYMTTVGDNKGRISNAVQIAKNRAQIIVTCGGLGPTVDDITRQAVADATNRELIYQQALYDQIAERFAGFKVKMTENNRQQAYLPENAIVIENPVGTAPSFAVEHEGSVIFCLPGVPREMKFLLTQEVIPYLLEKYQLGVIKSRTLRTAGIGESSLDDLIGREFLELQNPTVGLAAHHGSVDVRITAKAKTDADTDSLLIDLETKLRERLGYYVFGIDRDELEPILIKTLREHHATLAIVEAGMGDVIANRLQQFNNSEDVLVNSQAYLHPDELIREFDLANRHSLAEIGTYASEAICKSSGAASSIVVVSYPDVAENADNDHATIVAVHMNGQTRSRVYGFGAQAELAKEWVSRWAFAALWRLVSEANSATNT